MKTTEQQIEQLQEQIDVLKVNLIELIKYINNLVNGNK